MLRNLVDRVSNRIGLTPNRYSPVEYRLRQRDRVRRGTIFIKWGITAVVVAQVVGYFLLPPTPIDHLLTVVYSVLLLVVLGAFRTQGHALDTWMAFHEITRDQHETERQRMHDLLFAQARNEDLFETIDSIPEGWLFSLGMMNTAQRTGPIAFLWKPDVYLKNGKVESRAVMGEGDTLVRALQAAIVKARVWID